ncbi:MAG: arylsulfatase [Verrucomicrobiota bacterium]|nr:arylsulfatase [Verrucomicrobiota bacterium]
MKTIMKLRFVPLLILMALGAVAAADGKPNIVIIYADDLGYGDVGCYGATHVRTPNIDRLAGQGRRFTDAHTASAVCTPSRYTLLTGRYPVRRGNLWSPVFLKTPLVVDPDRTTIADVAKSAGYDTACIGKWHLGFGTKSPTDWNGPLKPGPLELGFDSYFGLPVVNSHPPFVYVENHRVVGLDQSDPFVYGKPAETRAFEEKYKPDAIGGAKKAHKRYDDELVGTTLASRAIDWIRAKAKSGNPFFLYFATSNIHHPFTPAKRFQGTSQAGRYGDFIHELDWIVGQVMKALREAKVADNTIVVFTSDNGGMLNRGGQEAWRRGHRLNGDLLGFKFDAWEGGHRVPFIARWPGKIEAGSVSGSLVSNVDLFATVAAITGRKLGQAEGEDSFNILPALTGEPDAKVRDSLLIAPLRRTHLSLRKGDWIYIGARGHGGFSAKKVGDHGLGGPAPPVVTRPLNTDNEDGKIKPTAPEAQLYNLGNDPYQKQNVIRSHPKIAEQMKAEMQSIRANPTAPHTALGL